MGRRFTLSAKSTLASVYMRTKLAPLPKPKELAHCSNCLALTMLTPIGEPK